MSTKQDLVKSVWSLRECFKQLRADKTHHLESGEIRLTIAQQDEICNLVETEKIRVPVLAWEAGKYCARTPGVDFARTPFGEYWISVTREKKFLCDCTFDDEYGKVHLTYEAAKSACQADYERRICGAINQNFSNQQIKSEG